MQQNVHRISYQIGNLNFIQENFMSEINSYGKYNSCRCSEIPTGFSKYPVGKLFLLRYFFLSDIIFEWWISQLSSGHKKSKVFIYYLSNGLSFDINRF